MLMLNEILDWLNRANTLDTSNAEVKSVLNTDELANIDSAINAAKAESQKQHILDLMRRTCPDMTEK